MLVVELTHELAGEGLDAHTHGDKVHREDILHDYSHSQDQAPKELLGDFVLRVGNANDLHLSFLNLKQIK